MIIPSIIPRWLGIPIFLFLFTHAPIRAQFPVAWDAGIFGDQFDELTDAVEFHDGGFVMGGMTYSSQGADITDVPRGDGDFLVVRTDEMGEKKWAHLFGGSSVDRMTALDLTEDQGVICVGFSESGISGDKSSTGFGERDFWIIKLNDKGDLLWEKSYGGSGEDIAFSVQVTPSGEIFVLGFSNSPVSGNKTADHYGQNDFWLLKLDADGNKIWDKSYGGAGDERLYYGALALTLDGNLVIGGSSDSDIGPMKSQANFGGMDFWILKVNPDGQILWEKSFGGLEEEQAQDIIASKDGGYLIGGGTRSDASGSKDSDFQGLIDFWLIKLDANGNLIWEKSYGGSGLELITGMAEDLAGNILLGGLSDSPISGSKTVPNLGLYDYWLIYIDNKGEEIWQEVYGAAGKDALTILFRTSDGGYFVGGDSSSGEGGYKTTSQYGFNDYWFFKLECGWDYEEEYSFVGCEGEDLLLNLKTEECPSCIFTWPDDSVGDSFNYGTDLLPFGDKFEVVVSTLKGCPITKEVDVAFMKIPSFSLGNDTTVYENTHVVLRPNPIIQGAQYIWSNGDTSMTTLASESGTYGLTIEINGCSIYDDRYIDFEENRRVFIPTAFSPNNDGINDVFRIYGDEAVKNIKHFSIYDRWGNRVFEKFDFLPGSNSLGWDGTYRGELLEVGVFIYFIEIDYTDGTSEQIKGDVSMLK